MAKKKKPIPGAPAPSSVSKKSKAASLASVLNLEHLLASDLHWSPSSLPSTLAALESALQKLRATQSSWPSALPHRDDAAFAAFTTWLATRGLELASSPVRIAGDADNATLYATRPIPEDEVFLKIPPPAILSTSTASSSPLAPFLHTLPPNPSLALTLHVLAEALSPSSPFAPYIAILPRAFTIPFVAPPTSYAALAPSPAHARTAKTLRTQLVHYVNVYKLLSRSAAGGLALDAFSYANFEWATAVVMTRQNQLLAPRGAPPVLALVPVWDMCNHAPGRATTSVIVGEDGASVECGAMRDFEEGEAVSIFYGRRSNVELALFSGFVQEGNVHDRVGVKVRFCGGRRENVLRVVDIKKRAPGIVSGADGDGMFVEGSVTGEDGGRVDERLILAGMLKVANVEDLKSVGEGAVDPAWKEAVVESLAEALKAYDEAGWDDGKNCGRELARKLHVEERRILEGAKAKLEERPEPNVTDF